MNIVEVMKVNINMEDFLTKAKKEKLNIIDVREKFQYEQGHIPTAISIPATYLLQDPAKYLQLNENYYVYCQFGQVSRDVMNNLNYLGYHIINIDGGYHNYSSFQKRFF